MQLSAPDVSDSRIQKRGRMMLIFLCPSCGRFGSLETPEIASDARCVYCDNEDIDWLSRPDLDKIQKTKVTTLEERTARVEKVLMSIMNYAHDMADHVGEDEKVRRHKMLHLALYLENFEARFENEAVPEDRRGKKNNDGKGIDQYNAAPEGGRAAQNT